MVLAIESTVASRPRCSAVSRHPGHHLGRPTRRKRYLDQPQSSSFVSPTDGRAETLRLDPHRLSSKRVAEFDEVWVLERSANVTAPEHAILIFAYRAEAVVVEHQHDEIEIQCTRSGEFLHGEQ